MTTLSGIANYSGFAVGEFLDPINGLLPYQAAVFAQANFTNSTMQFAAESITGGPHFSGSPTIFKNHSSFTGVVNSDWAGLSGQLNGHFYGPGAQEIGGLFNLSNNSGSSRLTGSFGAKDVTR
jgi:hypothetical protein